jgi:UDP-N-acetyl-D-galactosamine dehydrogenase
MNLKDFRIGIIGLGYVGLPLAIEFSKYYEVIGLDIDRNRVQELNNDFDRTKEVDIKVLQSKKKLIFTCNSEEIRGCNVFIVTVPTPINQFKSPNLEPLKEASKMIGKILKSNEIIIFESTVYPGCTEEVCVPIIEHNSGLKYNKDFYCGYSPERINPGDKINTLTKIVKVTS